MLESTRREVIEIIKNKADSMFNDAFLMAERLPNLEKNWEKKYEHLQTVISTLVQTSEEQEKKIRTLMWEIYILKCKFKAGDTAWWFNEKVELLNSVVRFDRYMFPPPQHKIIRIDGMEMREEQLFKSEKEAKKFLQDKFCTKKKKS